jgi:hypothetical protein
MENYKDFIREKCVMIDNLNELYVLSIESTRKDLQGDVIWFLRRNEGATIIKNDILKHENKEYKILFKYLNEMSELETNELILKWKNILNNKKNIKVKNIFKPIELLKNLMNGL